MLVRDIISPSVVLLHESDTVRHAVQLFQRHRLDALPVAGADGRLTGVFTKSNLYDLVLAGGDLDVPVRTVMVREPHTVGAAESFASVRTWAPTSPVGQSVVIDAAGRPVGLLTKADAINALLAEADRLASQLGAVVDAIEYGVVAVDAAGRVVVFNRAAAEFSGLAPEAALGQPAAAVLPALGLERALVGERIEGQRLALQDRVVLVNGRPVAGPGGALGAVAVLHDLTRLEQTARELESIRQLYQTLETVLEIAYDGIVVVDEQGIVRLVNRSLCEFLGRTAAELVGRHVTAAMENTRLHLVAQSGVAERGDVQVIRGTRHVVSCLPLLKDGRPAGAVGLVLFQGVQELRELLQRFESLERQLDTYRVELGRLNRPRYTFQHIVSASAEMERVKREARRAALSDLPVLLLGPSGTGKELLAHAIHDAGPRRGAPLVKVNCAAVPADLLESEFFGYEGGAFTGARSGGKAGKFELADGGTLFLDEIGDMSLDLQAKLLRVLQDGEFERVGGTRSTRVNVRVIAATNQDLEALVAEGRFRADLYYRLNVLPIQIPPLAQRRGDIPVLIQHFLERWGREMNLRVAGVAPAALARLQAYDWPGNVRELENVIRRAMYLLEGEVIEVEHLPHHLGERAAERPRPAAPPGASGLETEVQARERELISQALATTGGNRKAAAKLLGIGRATLYAKLRRLGLPAHKR